ncbi:DNA ligase D [Gemmatimonas groenlandica]|uniref:DNA ligase (ATP) n=1 Tax=Gemmatimonas groenlandica TaxID=2732249 RepID=A0A6M4IK99_9BACT|nr:DNA ligase D [Gemmatimonas groenlandica]QJR34288.1 DNA ligase D [Gemmatimonas groenlandica]
MRATFAPMLATSGTVLPAADGWAFEPKYDGIRVIAVASSTNVQLLSRNGIDKSAQFPEVVEALQAFVGRRRSTLVLDGELVGVEGGALGRFQSMQARVHERDAQVIATRRSAQPVALMVFDLLHDGARSLVDAPWRKRRVALERLFTVRAVSGGRALGALRLGDAVLHDHHALLARATAEGWEGIMAKRADAPYAVGVRSRDWLKLKLERQQEFVVGGWTEPRNSRPYLGALLLGYYRDGALHYAGHVGTGFTHDELAWLHAHLKRLERGSSPFVTTPAANATAHWVRPILVVEVRFNEWTNDGHLRQPAYLGVRTDKRARDIVREAVMPRATATPSADAEVQFTNLDKIFYPKAKKTKGDMVRYYTTIAPLLLPFIADRPLVLRRYPNGIGQPAFFQQRVAKGVPSTVRTEMVPQPDGSSERRIVGGELTTLLYCAQLGAIDVNPWHSRVATLSAADYSIIDLDPGEGATFRRVIDVARWTREVMDELGIAGALKTSGASGLHIYLPLPPGTSYDSALLLAKVIATRVVKGHSKQATVTRTVSKRVRGSVYVDYLQNVQGKSVASVFSLRAQPAASVSTPLRWDELTNDLDPRDFTIDTVPSQAATRATLWSRTLATPNDLESLQSAW